MALLAMFTLFFDRENFEDAMKKFQRIQDLSCSSIDIRGELKKKLVGPGGVNPQDQKLIFKNKERDSKTYLDVAKVKDKSKTVLVVDIVSKERRCLETLKIPNLEKASKSLVEDQLEN